MRTTQVTGVTTKKVSPKANNKLKKTFKNKVVGIISNLGKNKEKLKGAHGKLRSEIGRITIAPAMNYCESAA